MRGLIRTGGTGPGAVSKGSSFSPGSYFPDLTMDGTGQALALATGTLKLKVVNRGVTTESIRVAFGTSSANAIANLTITTGAATTGDYIASSADQGDGTIIYGVPANATYFAVANAVAADTQVVSITQGA